MITATNATKRFEDITAVDHICAEVKDGSVYGLIGSNGAGKSTFLRMLAGILQPDERLRSGRKPQAADVLQGHEKAGFGHLRRMQRHGLLILR